MCLLRCMRVLLRKALYASLGANNATYAHTRQWPAVLRPKGYSLVEVNLTIEKFPAYSLDHHKELAQVCL